MISRVAEGCFWLTRYLERLDHLARILDVYHALHIDATLPVDRRWRLLIGMVGQDVDFRLRIGAHALDDGEVTQSYLTWDADHPSSLYSNLRSARENARTVREIMSLEAWEAINDLWLWMQGRESRRLYDRDRSRFYERLMKSTVLFHGVSHATMLHDEPFAFMKLGRAVERAGQSARVLNAHVEGPDASPRSNAAEAAQWLAVLRCCCAYDPFFHSGGTTPTGDAVASFLVFERTLPRSVLYNLDEARRLLFELRLEDPPGLPRRSRTELERLRGEILQMDTEDLRRRGVGETLSWIVQRTDLLCDAIHDDYLAPPSGWLRHCVRVIEGVAESTKTERAA